MLSCRHVRHLRRSRWTSARRAPDRPGHRRARISAVTSFCGLRMDGQISPHQLATRLGASRTGVLQHLRALEAAHLVSRQQSVTASVGRGIFTTSPPTRRTSFRRTTTAGGRLLAAIERSEGRCWSRSSPRPWPAGGARAGGSGRALDQRCSLARSGARARGHQTSNGYLADAKSTPMARSGSTSTMRDLSRGGGSPARVGELELFTEVLAPTSSARSHPSGNRCCSYRITERTGYRTERAGD